jgi:hypothetical protein
MRTLMKCRTQSNSLERIFGPMARLLPETFVSSLTDRLHRQNFQSNRRYHDNAHSTVLWNNSPRYSWFRNADFCSLPALQHCKMTGSCHAMRFKLICSYSQPDIKKRGAMVCIPTAKWFPCLQVVETKVTTPSTGYRQLMKNSSRAAKL